MEHSLGARGSPPLERVEHRVDRLPWSVWMASLGASERVDVPWVTMMGWLPRSPPGCQELWPNVCTLCGHMHHRRAQSARATARRRNAKGRNDKRASLFQCFVSREGFQNPKLFSAPNYLSQLLGSLGTNSQFDLQGAKKISTFQSRIFIKEGILGICPQKLPRKAGKKLTANHHQFATTSHFVLINSHKLHLPSVPRSGWARARGQQRKLFLSLTLLQRGPVT